MSFSIVVFFIVLAFLLVLFRKRKLVFACLLISLLLIFSIGTGLLPKFVLKDLQVHSPLFEPDWKSSNAIVVLGFGTTKWPSSDLVASSPLSSSRVQEAARLYFNCKKQSPHCLIIASGGDVAKHGMSEAEVMARDLKELGVAAEDIIPESASQNTFQNAQFSSDILLKSEAKRVVLVTSGLHSRRALVYFSHFMPTPLAAPSDYWQSATTFWPQAINFSLMDMALHEYVGLIRFQIYNVMGWNKKN